MEPSFDELREELLFLDENFGKVDDSLIRSAYRFARRHVHPPQWGNKAWDALVLLTAHVLTMRRHEFRGRLMQSRAIDDVSAHYASMDNHDEYTLTVYGCRYRSLQRTLFVTRPMLWK